MAVSPKALSQLDSIVDLLGTMLTGQKPAINGRKATKKFREQIDIMYKAGTLGEDPSLITKEHNKKTNKLADRSPSRFNRLAITNVTAEHTRKLQNVHKQAYIAGSNPHRRFKFEEYSYEKRMIINDHPIILGKQDPEAAYEFFLNARERIAKGGQISDEPLIIKNKDGFWDPFIELLGFSGKDTIKNLKEVYNIHIVKKPAEIKKILLENRPKPSQRLSELRPLDSRPAFYKDERALIPEGSLMPFATANPEKLQESQMITESHKADVKIISIEDIVDVMPDIDEINRTYSGNAELKLEEMLKLLRNNKKVLDAVCQHYGKTPEEIIIIAEDRGGHFVDERIMQSKRFDESRHLMSAYTEMQPGAELKPVMDAMRGEREFVNAAIESIKELEAAGKKVNYNFVQTSMMMMSSLAADAPIMSFAGRKNAQFHPEFELKKDGPCYLRDYLTPGGRQATTTELEDLAYSLKPSKMGADYLLKESHVARAMQAFISYVDAPKQKDNSQRLSQKNKEFVIGLVAANPEKAEADYGDLISDIKTKGMKVQIFNNKELNETTGLFDFMKSVHHVAVLPDLRDDALQDRLNKAILASSLVVGVQIQDESMKGKGLSFIKPMSKLGKRTKTGWEFFHKDLVSHLHNNTFLLPQKLRYLYSHVTDVDFADFAQRCREKYTAPYIKEPAVSEYQVPEVNMARTAFVAGSATTEAEVFKKTAEKLGYELAKTGLFDAVWNGAGGKGAMGPTVKGVRRAQQEGVTTQIYGITTEQLAKKEQCDYALYENRVELVPNIEIREEKLTKPKFHYVVAGGMGTVKEKIKSANKTEAYTIVISEDPQMETYKGGVYDPVLDATRIKELDNVFVVKNVEEAIEFTKVLAARETQNHKRLDLDQVAGNDNAAVSQPESVNVKSYQPSLSNPLAQGAAKRNQTAVSKFMKMIRGFGK